MLNIKKQIRRMMLVAMAATAATVVFAQPDHSKAPDHENVIVAEFEQAPSAASGFSVSLRTRGKAVDVAGFAFKLVYNPNQVSVAGVSDNTGQPSAKVQYTVGPEVVDASGTTAHRVLTATTVSDLKKAKNLALIKFEKKPGFVPPFKFEVQDRETVPVVDGLQGADLENIPHGFDASKVTK